MLDTSILVYGRRCGPCSARLWPIWYGMVAGFSNGYSKVKYNLTKPIPLQVEHMRVVFIVESFHPSGPSLQTMTTSAQCYRLDTSYFTHNLKTCGGQEHLVPSRTGPKNQPTAKSPELALHMFIMRLTGIIKQPEKKLRKLYVQLPGPKSLIQYTNLNQPHD